MTVVAIHQPNYLPWMGYFRKVAQAHVMVFFDNVQMPGGKSFVSRNRVLGAQGPIWLTVPVERHGLAETISEVKIADRFWPKKHLRTMETSYAHTAGHRAVMDALQSVLTESHDRIADLNIALIKAVARLLEFDGIEFRRASEMQLRQPGADSIPEILQQTGATCYVTGHGAGTQRHLDEAELETQGIKTKFISDQFSPYPQKKPGFEPHLSIVDALFNCGLRRTRELLLEQPHAS